VDNNFRTHFMWIIIVKIKDIKGKDIAVDNSIKHTDTKNIKVIK
jgi:hypothetical protein